ncbi:MAG: EsaB/YukD family protein [Actinomycetota bacterium]
MDGGRTLLVTVVGPGGRRDLSLPADTSIRELLPPLIDLAGSSGGQGRIDEWTLSPAAGRPLPQDVSLADGGILDGAVLYLAPSLPDGSAPSAPPPQPPGDDLTPIQRTQAALPPRYSVGARIGKVLHSLVSKEGGSRVKAPKVEPPAEADDQSPFVARVEDAIGPQPSGNGFGAPAPPPPPGPGLDPALLSKPTPAGLTVERPPGAMERARRTWRRSDFIDQLCVEIAEPRLRRCVTIAVVSPKGGVGKTTVTSLIGMLLSLLRRDRIVAVDTNPDYGSLGRVLAPDSKVFVDDLLRRLGQPDLTLTGLDAQLGRAPHGLMVLPAPTDPERMAKLDEQAYSSVIERLKSFLGIIVLDCGTGLQEPAARAAIKAADQLVLVTDEQPAAASLVAEAGTLLARSGRPITLVVNKMPSRGNVLNVDLLCQYLPLARGLVVIPRELEAASRLATGDFDWSSAPRGWQEAIATLAIVLISDWPRLGLTLQE